MRRSRTRPGRQGTGDRPPARHRLHPVAAVQDWLQAVAIDTGAVFRGIDRSRRVLAALTAQSDDLDRQTARGGAWARSIEGRRKPLSAGQAPAATATC